MKASRTIAAVLLAFLVLVSSTNFIVGVHICMGEIQNVALFSKADSCEKEKTPACHRHEKAPCCEDGTVVHKGEDLKASIEHLHLAVPAPIDIEQPAVFISEIIPSSPASHIQYYNYDPPLRSSDLTVDHHVFLI